MHERLCDSVENKSLPGLEGNKQSLDLTNTRAQAARTVAAPRVREVQVVNLLCTDVMWSS